MKRNVMILQEVVQNWCLRMNTLWGVSCYFFNCEKLKNVWDWQTKCNKGATMDTNTFRNLTTDNPLEQCVKTHFNLSDEQAKDMVNSPECVAYLQIIGKTSTTINLLGDDLYKFDHYLARNYKPLIAICVDVCTKINSDYCYTNFCECVMNIFFDEPKHIMIFIDNPQSELNMYFMVVKHGIMPDRIPRYVVTMLSNKKYAHMLCCRDPLYRNFCKNHELQRRASITIIYEETNKHPATHKVERIFADSYIVDKILDFF